MEQTCPNCGRHCPITDLYCNRGRSYFGMEEMPEKHGEEQDGGKHEHGHHGHERDDSAPKAVRLLRQCWHQLHHGTSDPADLIASLTESELRTLEQLLEKCLNG